MFAVVNAFTTMSTQAEPNGKDERLARRRELKRLGCYVEPLLEDSTLRTNLHDDDAERLIEWALNCLEAEMVGSTRLAVDERAAQIEHKSSLVTLIVRTINVIMGERSAPEPPTESQLRFMLNDLLQSKYALTGKRVNPYQVKRVKRVAKEFMLQPRDQLFAEMFALIENTREINYTTQSTAEGDNSDIIS